MLHRYFPVTLDALGAELRIHAGVLIHDCQYGDDEYPAKVGWGHSPVSYVVGLAAAARTRNLFLFHHDPTRNDDQLDALVAAARARAVTLGARLRIDAAAEGQEVELKFAPDAALETRVAPGDDERTAARRAGLGRLRRRR